MEDLDLAFTLYALDRRSPSEVRSLLERQFGCAFAPGKADRPRDELENWFEAETLGIYVSLELGVTWPEGFVYRLSGGTADSLFAPGAMKVSLDGHIARILRHAGLELVMSKEEFASRNRERFPELYHGAEA